MNNANSIEAYNTARLKASDLLSQLNQKLALHAGGQSRDAGNCGFAVDLDAVNAKLAQAIAFVGCGGGHE